MDRHDEHEDVYSASLVELAAAERAGVFRRTRLELRQLLHAPQPSIRTTRRRWLFPGAAAAAIAAVVWGAMFHAELNRLRRNKAAVALRNMSDCLSGPGESVDARCADADYDDDGSVTLRDFQPFQLAFASNP